MRSQVERIDERSARRFSSRAMSRSRIRSIVKRPALRTAGGCPDASAVDSVVRVITLVNQTRGRGTATVCQRAMRTNCEHRHLHQWHENTGRIRTLRGADGLDCASHRIGVQVSAREVTYVRERSEPVRKCRFVTSRQSRSAPDFSHLATAPPFGRAAGKAGGSSGRTR
jgi:hypothetical protein